MTSYDAWSELPAPLAEALRASLYSGDWSTWEDDVVDAFRRAFNENDWSAFDAQTAATIRAAVGQEQLAVEAEANQERFEANAKLDREMAAEMRELSAKYTDFHANAAEILGYGIKSNLTNLDQAYKAWRSSKGHDGPALAGQTAEPPSPIAEMETRVSEIRAQLDDLGHNGTLGKRSTLKFEMEALQDKIALALTKGNDLDQGLRDIIDEYNNARSTRVAGPDKSRVSKAEKRAHMDLEAMDLISGRTKPPTQGKQTQADRDNADLDTLDRQALAIIHGESIGEPDVSQPNAEAVLLLQADME